MLPNYPLPVCGGEGGCLGLVFRVFPPDVPPPISLDIIILLFFFSNHISIPCQICGFRMWCLITQLCPLICDPANGSPQRPRFRGLPSKNTGVCCHFLLHGGVWWHKMYFLWFLVATLTHCATENSSGTLSKIKSDGAFLAVQWLSICLAMQEMWVDTPRSTKIPHASRATKPGPRDTMKIHVPQLRPDTAK